MNDENLIFVSASEFGSYLKPADDNYRRFGTGYYEGLLGTDSRTGFVPTDFAGINSNIYEPVSSSFNLLGFPPSMPDMSYVNWGSPNTPAVSATDVNDESFIGKNYATTDIGSGWSLRGPGVILNSLILHRQGPYGWPTWKQIRVGNHPINRVHKKNNIFSYAQKSVASISAWDYSSANDSLPTNDKIKTIAVAFNVTESCVTNKHKPLRSSFKVLQDNQHINLDLKHSYGNLKEHYTNELINSKLVFPNNFREDIEPIYKNLKDIYINKIYLHELADVSADDIAANPYGMIPYKKWLGMIYAENVFPKQKNTFLLKTRQRTKYSEVSGLGADGYDRRDYNMFWKNELTDRNIRTPEVALNSQGFPLLGANSLWSLDTDLPTGSSGFGYRNIVGELQVGLGYSAQEATLWAWYPYTASVILHRVPVAHEKAAANGLDQWVYGVPYYATNLASGKKPFFNSYENFAEDIRGLGKEYSILPEFKISDHMDFYINSKDGNFLARNDAFLSLPGASLSSSAATLQNLSGDRSEINLPIERYVGFNEDFFLEYSHSDFMKYFKTFKEDHKEAGEVETYSFTMKGVKKLLPYKGFYPHERVLQLGTLLSQSYAPYVKNFINPLTTGIPNVSGTWGWNIFLKPLISPGIVFNSLKSCLAVDYPVITGSVSNLSISKNLGTGLSYWTAGPQYRLPFETAIEPHTYLPVSSSMTNKNLMFDEPIRVGSANYACAANWSGDYLPLYSMAANNFFGEIPKFFLRDQRLTDFVSKPESEFKPVRKDKFYYMDVVLKKTPDMVLCEGQYEAGPTPYTASLKRGSIYGPPYESWWAINENFDPQRDPAYAPVTPPYFYEDSIARILYVARSSGVPTLDDILGEAIVETVYTGSSLQLGIESDIASDNKMKVSSSVNLFGRSRYKKVTYSTNVGPDGNYIPTSFEDTDAFAFQAWSVGTKFESPALNFSASGDYHNASTGRGLWGGYGSPPTGGAGLYMELRDSFPQFRGSDVQENTGSLIEVCGFKAANKKIGTPAQQKTISEAIVAIPFIWSADMSKLDKIPPLIGYPDSTKKFFKINKHFVKTALKESSQGIDPEDAKSFSVTDMVIKMQKYNLPPKFDFITFPELHPIVMYIFEFEHSLSQQDLTDIWQGLMPEISRKAELQDSTITHRAHGREFFGFNTIPPETRWMLFKIKKKAEKSYFATTADSTDDSRFKFQFGNEEKPPEYNYNWPYDFFSLVELAKMEAAVEFKPPQGPLDNPNNIIPE